jgi:hypothetical protein
MDNKQGFSPITGDFLYVLLADSCSVKLVRESFETVQKTVYREGYGVAGEILAALY